MADEQRYVDFLQEVREKGAAENIKFKIAVEINIRTDHVYMGTLRKIKWRELDLIHLYLL
jgi:hypothetical protein